MLYQFCSRFGLVSLPEVFQGVQPLCLDALGQLGKLCPIAAHGVLVPDCGPQHSQQEQHQQPTASVVLSAGFFRFGNIRSRLRGRTVLGRFAGGQEACSLRLRVITGGTADHIQQPECGVVRRRHRAEPAALFAAQNEDFLTSPLRAACGQLRAHHPPGCLRPGKGQPDGIRLFRFETGTSPFLDLGVAQCPKVKDLFGPGHCFQTCFQQGSGGGIAADQQAVMGLQCVDHRSGKAGIPCPVQIRLKLSL